MSPLLSILLLIFLTIDYCSGYKKTYDPSEEKEIPVRIKLLGDLATPHPDSGIELGFVPKQVYYQVRRYDTKKRVPQSEAYKEASTPEEIINAPRLREVLTHKKTQEVYEEQGYEDAGYDHGGSARHKQENERLLESDATEFGKDSAPNHSEDDGRTEEERPSQDNREIDVDNSDRYTDNLSGMNSDAKHRRMKPNGNDERDNEDNEGKIRRTNRERFNHQMPLHEKRKQSKKEDLKEKELKHKEKNKENHFPNKRSGKKDKQKMIRRIGSDQGHTQKSSEHMDFDTEKYPFYNLLNSNKYTKHSALKYALNPQETPVKLSNQMSFYNSRKLECDEVTGPVVETPDGEEKSPENSELKSPKRGKPRMGRLGKSIDCLKRKFFGHDPLDNPFFKESFDS